MKLIIDTQIDVETEIMKCQKANHIQQVAFSTYHHAITQICFYCKKVRTSIEREELEGRN